MCDYAKTAKEQGLKCIIAGAGGAAHLPGMVSALTTLPVLGVPVESKSLKGMDSLLSIVQMPGGIPRRPSLSAGRAERGSVRGLDSGYLRFAAWRKAELIGKR